MLSTQEAMTALERLFRRCRIVELPELFRTLRTNSRMSVFRRLRAFGYRSSFTHRGRYYTHLDIPDFDAAGLWFHGDVGFSRHGTLKATLVEVVEEAVAGMTHGELRKLLRTRCHDTLLDLVREEELDRRRPAGTGRFVYVSVDSQRTVRQLTARVHGGNRSGDLVPLTVVVDILLEVVRAGEVHVPPGDVVVRLQTRGVAVLVEQVMWVYASYGLEPGKKTPEARPPNFSGR